MVATTRNSLISLVQIFNFFVRTWLCEDMAVEGHLGLMGYSMLQAPSGLSGRREARKSSWLLCSFAHAGREGISLSVLQTRKKHPFSDLSHQHTLSTAFLSWTQQRLNSPKLTDNSGWALGRSSRVRQHPQSTTNQ